MSILRRLLYVIVGLLLSALSGISQTPSKSISLRTSVSPEVATVGSKTTLEVDMTNESSERIYVQLCNGFKAEFNVNIEVRDSHGNPPPESHYFRAVKGEPSGKPDLMITENFGVRSIEPGETVKFTADLNRLFDLTKPDRYEVTLEKPDPVTHSPVRSNSTVLDIISK